jgi:hypothetical protein
MKRLSRARPTPALIVALIALVAAMSGAAVALPGKGEVTSNDIAKDAVRSKHIEKNAVGSQEVAGKSLKGNDLKDGAIANKQLKDDAVDSAKVEADGLNDTDLSDYELLGDGTDGTFVKVTATEAATEAAAQTAAPETPLYSKGQVSLYAKCFRDNVAGVIQGEIYARTTANGAILQGTDTYPSGNATLLDTTTIEEDSEVDTQSETTADAGSIGEAESVLIAADGTDLHLLTHIGVKQGTFPGGDGAFGAGNVCLFGGAVTG